LSSEKGFEGFLKICEPPWRVERLEACRVWVALKKIPSDFAKRDEIGVMIAADA
jgi:hypothetical protein